ncbi:hypothetical protein PanWU01x14_003310 [Parasponia andersonii]|uniref:Uncharacterized protein n=1 Tax=Parasponia andersonii TaxID=3476 RepID=A0A2P5E5E7_PARAD|nr:hypothetical protein PanWU01x14_003310 [Parasponia andersonii]
MICWPNISSCFIKWYGWDMALKESNVPEKLVFPREGCAARAKPLVLATMLLVSFEISNNREFLYVASAASIALVTVGSLVVVFNTQNSLQRLKLLVIFVPLAASIGTGIPLDNHRFGAWVFMWLSKCCWGFILIAMTPHVHPQVRVPLEPLSANRTEVGVRRQDFFFL